VRGTVESRVRRTVRPRLRHFVSERPLRESEPAYRASMSVKSDNKVKRRSINREKQMLDSRELLRCSSIHCIAGIGWDAEKIQGRVRVKAATDGYTDSTGDSERWPCYAADDRAEVQPEHDLASRWHASTHRDTLLRRQRIHGFQLLWQQRLLRWNPLLLWSRLGLPVWNFFSVAVRRRFSRAVRGLFVLGTRVQQYYPYSYYGGYPYRYSYYGSGYGYDGSTVAAVQRRLGEMGYYHGVVDGVIGARTRAAIAAFESRQGLVVDGTTSRPLLNRLGLA
jgi:hypothetical protein